MIFLSLWLGTRRKERDACTFDAEPAKNPVHKDLDLTKPRWAKRRSGSGQSINMANVTGRPT